MFLTFKYNGKMDAKPDWLLAPKDVAQIDFNLERLNPQTPFQKIKERLKAQIKLFLLWLSYHFFPLLRFDGLQFVTRHADVTWVLEHSDKFPVHFNPEVREFAGGSSTFMLALDGMPHKCQRALVGGWFTDEQNAKFADRTTAVAKKLLAASGGRIDVMKDYFTRASAEVGIDLLGLDVDDPDAFADWTLAMSNANFADFEGDAVARELGMYAAWRERGVVDRAIAQAFADPSRARNLLAYLIRPEVLGRDDDSIRSVIFGVSVALAPTITIGAGNMLAYLQANPAAMAQCVAAAREHDRARLYTLLLEVGRLQPALNPGQFRYAPADVTLPGGLFGPRRIKGGSTVMVCTATALRDRRVFKNPSRFMPDRPGNRDRAWLMFGHGPHLCLGDELAMQQLTRLFEELLSCDGIDFAAGMAGRVKHAGPFPRQQLMAFTIPGRPRGQAKIICRIPLPVTPAVDAEVLCSEVRALMNPAREDIERALKGAGIIHFMSMTVIGDPVPKGPTHSLIVELRADGDDRDALAALVSAIGPALRPILAQLGGEGTNDDLVDFLEGKRLKVATWPWGATGLHYDGTSEFSAYTKDRQAELAAFARKAVDFYLRATSGRTARPITTIQFVRSLINGTFNEFKYNDFRPVTEFTRRDKEAAATLTHLELHGKRFDDMLIVPSRQRLEFVDWRDRSDWDKGSDYLASPAARPAMIVTVVSLLIATGLIASALGLSFGIVFALVLAAGLLAAAYFEVVGLSAALWSSLGLVGASLLLWFEPKVVGGFLLAAVGAIGLLLATTAFLVFAFFRNLRRLELADRPDERDPDIETLRAIAERENALGFQQNHITAVSDTKAGWFRRMTLSMAMWGIGVLVTYWFRRGFIATMGTIHFASWVRLPDSGKLLFVSNYDGSWNSYLEDFITKVPSGQTAAWTHAIGFPRTRNLTGEGVRDGDRFKRWVRRQQRPTDFWFSRRPDLTLDRIRSHALIHDGLARASSDTAAREWLCNFGSAQRTDAMLETDEIQTIMLHGLPNRPHGAVLLLTLPTAPKNCSDFIAGMLGEHRDPTKALPADIPQLCFGEMASDCDDKECVAYLAFSALGLEHCNLPISDDTEGLAGFPIAFVDGMASRARIIGDRAPPHDGAWDDRSFDGRPVHAALQLLAETVEGRERHVRALRSWLAKLGGDVLDSISTDPPDPQWPERDHFRFRDGVSQPAIRGSLRGRRALERDRMEPGEFIFGYRGNQGYIAPSPRVPIDRDRLDQLPDITVEPSSRFPAARKQQERSPPFRDFGRNGSFMVIRRLEQHVEEFEAFTDAEAKRLDKEFSGLKAVIGANLDARWVAAKMIGRWQDGMPLTARIGADRIPKQEPRMREDGSFIEKRLSPTDVDFSFARDDPRGLACPLGAHVRRVNPRDSLLPDDPEGLAISNRHRIIRRGRSYRKDVGDKTETGLVFIGLCGDIERQFEFIQQRWINGSNFHTLDNETDPILSEGRKTDSTDGVDNETDPILSDGCKVDGTDGADNPSVFTIPTVAGPVRLMPEKDFVTAHGGGYFFLPGRSALHFLASLAKDSPTK